jgi:O-methyltransferase
MIKANLEDLMPILGTVRPYSLVPDRPLLFTMECVIHAINASLPGVIVECGVYRGGASMAMLLVQKHLLSKVSKPVYMLDSFEGLPPISKYDGAHAEAFEKGLWGSDLNNCAVSVEEVEVSLRNIGLMPGEYHLVKGWFNTTTPALANTLHHDGIAVLRLDGDWYESTKVCLENLGPLVNIDGVVIIDDYYHFDGCARAVHEYLALAHRPCKVRTIPGDTGAYFLNRPRGAD